MRIRTACTSLFLLCVFIFSCTTSSLSAETPDEAFLKKVEQDSLQYFQKYSHPKTLLTGDSSLAHSPSSVAATGFHLLALILATENGWMDRRTAYNRCKQLLHTLKYKAETNHGFFYHFISRESGKRVWNSEASSIDTALLIANALLAGAYFPDSAVAKLAQELYDRVEWDWMLNNSKLLSHGYLPETGFLPYYWDTYSEHLILQVLAIGAEKHAIPAGSWKEWFRLEDTYQDRTVIFAHSGSLFTYQFSHLFIDFRKLYDLETNYFDNSVQAIAANQEFCEENAANFKTYEKELWGLSACLGPKGYKAYGAKPGRGFHDGTVAPYAILSSLVFSPDESLATIKKIYEQYQDKIYGVCGFRDGMNLDQNWFSESYIGIDQGVTAGMIENYRTGLIWKLFMPLPAVQNWIKLCNIKDTPEVSSTREVLAIPTAETDEDSLPLLPLKQ